MRSSRVHGCVIILLLLLTPLPLWAENVPDTEKQEEPAASVERAVTSEKEQEEFPELKPIPDPLEPLNRLVFFLNDRIYFALAKPIAQGYGLIVPEWARVRVRNVFDNLRTPTRFLSCLLQGKMKCAGNELVRLLLNTTLGMGGMFDVVDYNLQIKSSGEDIGLALAHHGIGEGFYVVLPFLGPSSARDTVGSTADFFLYPVSYITPFKDWFAVRSYQFENDVSLSIGEYEDLLESSVDPYVAMKDAYSEYRRSKVKEGAGENKEVTGAPPELQWPGR